MVGAVALEVVVSWRKDEAFVVWLRETMGQEWVDEYVNASPHSQMIANLYHLGNMAHDAWLASAKRIVEAVEKHGQECRCDIGCGSVARAPLPPEAE